MLQAAGILEALNLCDNSKWLAPGELAKTMETIASIAIKFLSQEVHVRGNLRRGPRPARRDGVSSGPDPLREVGQQASPASQSLQVAFLKQCNWQIVITVDNWLALFESRRLACPSDGSLGSR